MADREPRFLAEYKDIYSGFLDRARSLIVDGYWHLRANRQKHKTKTEDFAHVQNATEGVLEALEILIDTAEGERDKPGVQPLINKILSAVNIHLDRVAKYYPKNVPKTFKTKESQREEGKFQQLVFKGEQKIKSQIRKLNIENNMDSFELRFYNNQVATLPMKQVLCDLIPQVAAKIESLDIDWDLIMDNGLLINMPKRDIPDYNNNKHFWDQELPSLQFWVSEWNKINKGITIDGYVMSPSMYFHLNYFKTPIKNQGNKIINPPLRDNEWYVDEIKKHAKREADKMKPAGVMIYGTRRFAKALRNDSKLFYENREGTIGEAKVGDKIFGSDGKLTKITGVYPQGKKKLNKITFQDGRESLACNDHLWTVFSRNSRTWITLTTKQLMENKLTYNREYKDKNRKNSVVYNYYIPITKPLQYKKSSLDIDPYLLGLWLGDGHSQSPRFTSEDQEIINYIKEYCDSNNLIFRKTSITENKNLFDISITTEKNKINPLLDIIRDKNLQYNKHIPVEYFRGSLNQRLSLLQGIMDTDGTCTKGGSISISLANKKLSKEVLLLARSLGISAKIDKKTGSYIKKDGRLNTYWKITMFTSLPVFRLKRKLCRIDTNPNSNRKNKINRVAITSIERHSEAEATCIRVNNDSHEFVTNDYVVTHNSTIEASHCHHGLLVYPTETGTITASNSEDLASITDKMNKSMDYIHPAFAVNVLSGKGWDKEVDIGLKSKSGAKTYLLFKFFIINTDSGSKKGGQKTAGGNPIVFVADEIGKEDFLKSYRAAIPSFESDDGWVCQPLYTGTGGDEDLSSDAEKVLADPGGNDFIEMDWDVLEYGIPKNLITWVRRKFAWFIPAQMSTKTGFRKIKKNFAEFLGLESEQLSRIPIYVTDWEHNNQVVKNRRATLSGQALQQEIVFRPIDPEECFMSARKNPYPAQGAKMHKSRLQSEGDKVYGTSRRISLYRNKENPSKIEMELETAKKVNEFPHNGSFTDCPFLLYDNFPEEKPLDPFRFVAGLDDYKQDESNENKKGSIGAFYIFDRLKRKIVLGLANRPDPHPEFHRQIHMALDAWNCKCFPENEDMDFKKYLDRLTDVTPAMYLYKGFDAYDDFSKFQNGKRKFGWRPDKNTVPIIRGYTLDYVKDDLDFFDNEGNVTHTVSGFERIEDIQLLEEMVKYKPDGNFDRLTAFGSCLAIDYYLTCNHITPKSRKEKQEEYYRPNHKLKKTRFFTKTRRSPFSR